MYTINTTTILEMWAFCLSLWVAMTAYAGDLFEVVSAALSASPLLILPGYALLANCLRRYLGESTFEVPNLSDVIVRVAMPSFWRVPGVEVHYPVSGPSAPPPRLLRYILWEFVSPWFEMIGNRFITALDSIPNVQINLPKIDPVWVGIYCLGGVIATIVFCFIVVALVSMTVYLVRGLFSVLRFLIGLPALMVQFTLTLITDVIMWIPIYLFTSPFDLSSPLTDIQTHRLVSKDGTQFMHITYKMNGSDREIISKTLSPSKEMAQNASPFVKCPEFPRGVFGIYSDDQYIGTAFRASYRGATVVFTAKHVVDDLTGTITIAAKGRKAVLQKGDLKLLVSSISKDFAMFSDCSMLYPLGVKTIPVGRYTHNGRVQVTGSPDGFNYFQNVGTSRRSATELFVVEHGASTLPGMSGSPMTQNGKVVAIHCGTDGSVNRGVAIDQILRKLSSSTRFTALIKGQSYEEYENEDFDEADYEDDEFELDYDFDTKSYRNVRYRFNKKTRQYEAEWFDQVNTEYKHFTESTILPVFRLGLGTSAPSMMSPTTVLTRLDQSGLSATLASKQLSPSLSSYLDWVMNTQGPSNSSSDSGSTSNGAPKKSKRNKKNKKSSTDTTSSDGVEEQQQSPVSPPKVGPVEQSTETSQNAKTSTGPAAQQRESVKASNTTPASSEQNDGFQLVKKKKRSSRKPSTSSNVPKPEAKAVQALQVALVFRYPAYCELNKLSISTVKLLTQPQLKAHLKAAQASLTLERALQTNVAKPKDGSTTTKDPHQDSSRRSQDA